jgi:FkbM family methyltransferase
MLGVERDRAVQWLRRWQRPSFVRSVYGPYLANTPGDRTFDLCLTGYGPFVADAIAAHDREFLFLDIGANLGLFSLLADRHPLCREVVAFEPLPSIFRNLTANIMRNKAGKIRAFRAAVLETGAAKVSLSFNPRHSGLSRVLADRRQGTITAPVVNGERLAALIPTWPSSILAKLDVEGAEIETLAAVRAAPFYPAVLDVIVEISERNLGAERKAELLRSLAADGFTLVLRDGPEEHYDALYRRRAVT